MLLDGKWKKNENPSSNRKAFLEIETADRTENSCLWDGIRFDTDIFEISQWIWKGTQLLHTVVTEGGRQLDIHFEFHYSGFLGKCLSPQEVLNVWSPF